MVQAQNNVNYFYIVHMTEKAITQLKNEGLNVDKVIDGTEKFKISWWYVLQNRYNLR